MIVPIAKRTRIRGNESSKTYLLFIRFLASSCRNRIGLLAYSCELVIYGMPNINLVSLGISDCKGRRSRHYMSWHPNKGLFSFPTTCITMPIHLLHQVDQ